MIKLKNNISGAIISVSEKDYKILEEKGRIKNFSTIEVKPSKEVSESVENNKKK